VQASRAHLKGANSAYKAAIPTTARACRLPRSGNTVTSPTVTAAVREQTDCSSAKGAPLEADGGPGTATSHWDTASFQGELMDGSSDGVERTVLSNLTLGLAKDSGWYIPNYGAAGFLRYGFHAGCDMLVRDAAAASSSHRQCGSCAL
jgi:Leishmanolysin